jgi:hypothetical protein
MISKRKFELGLRKYQKLLGEITLFIKKQNNLMKQKCCQPFYKNNLLHFKRFYANYILKKKSLLSKASLQKPDALMHVDHIVKATDTRWTPRTTLRE